MLRECQQHHCYIILLIPPEHGSADTQPQSIIGPLAQHVLRKKKKKEAGWSIQVIAAGTESDVIFNFCGLFIMVMEDHNG